MRISMKIQNGERRLKGFWKIRDILIYISRWKIFHVNDQMSNEKERERKGKRNRKLK